MWNSPIANIVVLEVAIWIEFVQVILSATPHNTFRHNLAPREQADNGECTKDVMLNVDVGLRMRNVCRLMIYTI